MSIQSFTFKEIIDSMEPSQRRLRIKEMCSGNKGNTESLFLNDLVCLESENVLNKHGQKFSVTIGKSDKRTFKSGKCYSNSVKMMDDKGYGYVEGYVIDQDGKKISHSWNVDYEGHHVDFTYTENDNCEYFGIIIPEEKVYEVSRKNGFIWYSLLPFVDDDFNYIDD